MTSVTRHESRERALAILYEAAQKHLDPNAALEQATVAPDPYSEQLVNLVSEFGDQARLVIEETAANWPIERIGLIDRLVMELALCELQSDDPPPVAVVIDEAVELAKTYSTASSGSFVNGVLSAALA